MFNKHFYKEIFLAVTTILSCTLAVLSPTVTLASPNDTSLFTNTAQANDQTSPSSAVIITRFEPPLDAAIGLRLSPERLETLTINDAKVISHPFISLSFSLPTEGNHNVVGALLRSAGGKIEGTELKPEWTLEVDDALPQCSEDLPSPTTLAGQLGMLQSLVEVRSGRARVARELFMIRLTNFSKERIKKLESGFGLIGKYSQPIDEVVDPYTIIDRVTRLLHAVRTYSLHKSARNLSK